MFRRHSIYFSLQLLAAVALPVALGAGPALAEGSALPASVAPAAPAAAGQSQARESFVTFSRSWVEKIQRAGGAPTPGGGTTRREIDADFTTELRPTGQASAPYVGLLRYTEHVYRCSGTDRDSCTIQASTPVTEIFRYENGRWVY